jgi:hypothetical protein
LFGTGITPLGFNNFEFQGAQVLIPVDAWDIDIESPPELPAGALEELRRRGQESIDRLVEYIAAFVGEFQKIDIDRALTQT